LDDLQEGIRDQAAEWVTELSEVARDGVARGKKLGSESYEKILQGFDHCEAVCRRRKKPHRAFDSDFS
jgi:hypothetical protein